MTPDFEKLDRDRPLARVPGIGKARAYVQTTARERASRGAVQGVFSLEMPTMNATTRMPRTCAVCRRRIDWSGADHHRAPGVLEDGVVLCRDCAYRIERREAA